MRTKWEILQARAEEMRVNLENAEKYLKGLERTPCGLKCAGCQTVLKTEADFAKHFVIPDERYLNLGDCPVAREAKYHESNQFGR